MFKIKKGYRAIIGTILIIASIILHEILGEDKIITIVFMLLTTLVNGLPTIKKAISGLRYKIVGIDALVTIAVIGAIFLPKFYEAAAVTYLFMIGDYLEARTIEKTRSSIKELLNLAPEVARVIRNNEELMLSPADVLIGDRVIVKHGEKIAVDGRVLKGEASINQAIITGEAIPVLKDIGKEVFSGTIVENGYLEVEALRVGENTTFNRILELVEEAQDSKAKTQKFIERFSKYYTPIIIGFALVLYIITFDIELSLTLLVIACPGALVISTPVSIVAGIGNAAKKGILYKGGESTEGLSKAKVIAFDKTGTITYGRPKVTKIFAVKLTKHEILRITAIGEAYSVHPLALAIINEAKAENIKVDEEIETVEIINGRGIAFKFLNEMYLIGNRSLMQNEQIDYSKYEEYLQKEENEGQTTVILANKEGILGIISIKDEIRLSVKETINKLRKNKINKIIMLTGDNDRSAKRIALEAGIDEVYSELLPEDKVSKVRELKDKYGYVVMVGDGVNDAPALASANLGIAMGGAGKDIAMETADIVIMNEQIMNINYAYKLSKSINKNIIQNIIFALVIAAFLLTGVLIGFVNMTIGMLVHEVSVLLVIINAVRLLGFGKHDKI